MDKQQKGSGTLTRREFLTGLFAVGAGAAAWVAAERIKMISQDKPNPPANERLENPVPTAEAEIVLSYEQIGSIRETLGEFYTKIDVEPPNIGILSHTGEFDGSKGLEIFPMEHESPPRISHYIPGPTSIPQPTQVDGYLVVDPNSPIMQVENGTISKTGKYWVIYNAILIGQEATSSTQYGEGVVSRRYHSHYSDLTHRRLANQAYIDFVISHLEKDIRDAKGGLLDSYGMDLIYESLRYRNIFYELNSVYESNNPDSILSGKDLIDNFYHPGKGGVFEVFMPGISQHLDLVDQLNQLLYYYGKNGFDEYLYMIERINKIANDLKERQNFLDHIDELA